MLNVVLQLLISLQIHETGYLTYGQLGDQLMDGTCWKVRFLRRDQFFDGEWLVLATSVPL